MSAAGKTAHEAAAVIALGRRVFRVRPQMRLVTAIEDEMEGIAPLARRFERGQWTVCELVAVVHMMIESCGTTMDYHELGDAMMAEGL
jgi:hypothetical protein